MALAAGRRRRLLACVPVVVGLTLVACGRGESGKAGQAGTDTTAAGRGAGAGMNDARADSAMRVALADSGNWASYGRDYTNERYTPLAQLTAGNVSGLKLAWSYHTGLPQAFEASPVIVNGTMYVSTPLNHVVALDAATGQKKWEYVAKLGQTIHCCGPVNRGVAVYGGRVYMGQLDGKLVALDAANGNVVWSAQVGLPKDGYALNGPPVAVDGKVITGISGGEYGIRGYVTAYDAADGHQIWRFYTIPSPEEGGWWGTWSKTDPFGTTVHKDRSKERADSAKYPDAWKTGGGGMWQAVAVDRDLGLVIFAVGNPSPDLDGAQRPGDNLYANSLVAIDLATGKHKWHMQEIQHDVWDLDATSPVVLFDVKDKSGQTVKAVGQAGKTGWVYILDRATGQPIRRSDAFVPQSNMFAEPTETGTRMLPGANGGSEWSPAAYSPQTGYMYVLGLHQPMQYIVAHDSLQKPGMWLSGAFVGNGEPQYGLFSAVDVNTGKIAWQKRVKDPMIGGALATGGGLVFTGTADKQFLAFDAKSGRQLWSYQAKGGVNAPPVSYAVNGQQYVAVAAGGNYQINSPRSDELLVFSLNGNGAAAGGTGSATTGPAPAAGTGSGTDTARGRDTARHRDTAARGGR